jgi:RNA polymerase sigma factor (sigma-70 family)
VKKMKALTRREREILGLIVQGLTNKQIAELLCISQATVKTHVENIIGKLGVSDRTQAAVWAVRAGVAGP